MVVRSVLVCLLAVSLSLTRSFAFPQSLLTSTQDKYSLTGMVVNSATGEPIRGALVQIYINGQSSQLTGLTENSDSTDFPQGKLPSTSASQVFSRNSN